ncbi:unnamed protein product [Acanthocheilonema viteae]|uniref:Uncharacterized protein n=1 Tax=Acanthocheilonema viteae TaxID=6277 RepID=A0A498SL30_ACAVI|nr:unnamed protein product [Acanthocheilonema viteae]
MENPGFGNVKESGEERGQLAGRGGGGGGGGVVPRAQQLQGSSAAAVTQQIIGSSSSSLSLIKPSTTATTIQKQVAEGGGGGTRGAVRVRQRPHIPPKPQMDTVRYSMANVQESCDWELDTLLGELSALEQQLTVSGDQALLGLPTLPMSASRESSLNQSKRNSTLSASVIQHNDVKRTGLQSHAQHSYSYHDNFIQGSGTTGGATMSTDCPSPDRDSAFGDSSSTESRNNNRNCRNSAISCSDSCRGSLNTPSPTQQDI